MSLADLENKFLYCDVQKPDPDYFKPKNLVFKIDYKKQANLGTGYFYRLDGAEMPGWKESTFGVNDWERLPENARNYLLKLEELCNVPLHIISTGPERNETIMLQHPFEVS